MPSYRPVLDRFLEKFAVEKNTGCWTWTATQCRGYGYIGRENGGGLMRAHRFSYEHYKGRIPKGMLVLHDCNNSLCVNPDHLRLGTHSENMNDMVKAGRRIGRNSGSSLSVARLEKMQRLLDAGHTQQAVAKAIGVDRTTVQRTIYRGGIEIRHKKVSLTEHQRQEAVRLLKYGFPVLKVAQLFGVDRKTIRNIRDS